MTSPSHKEKAEERRPLYPYPRTVGSVRTRYSLHMNTPRIEKDLATLYTEELLGLEKGV